MLNRRLVPCGSRLYLRKPERLPQFSLSKPAPAVNRFSILIRKQPGQKHFASLLVRGKTGGYSWHQHVKAP